jgi:hypothetical protein
MGGGRGPAPKAQRVRERATVPLEEIEDRGELYGFPLPEMPDEPWHPADPRPLGRAEGVAVAGG